MLAPTGAVDGVAKKKPDAEDYTKILVSMPQKLIDELDALVELKRDELRSRTFSRSDLLRIFAEDGVATEKRKRAENKPS